MYMQITLVLKEDVDYNINAIFYWGSFSIYYLPKTIHFFSFVKQ